MKTSKQLRGEFATYLKDMELIKKAPQKAKCTLFENALASAVFFEQNPNVDFKKEFKKAKSVFAIIQKQIKETPVYQGEIAKKKIADVKKRASFCRKTKSGKSIEYAYC